MLDTIHACALRKAETKHFHPRQFCVLDSMHASSATMLQVCGWVDAVATKPVWAKMTPNITDIKVPARASLAAGMEGVSAINTIQSVIGMFLVRMLLCCVPVQ